MKFKIESKVLEEETLIKTFSKDFKARSFNEETIVLDKPGISGSIKHIQLDGFCLLIKDLQVDSGYSLKIGGNNPIFKLHFELEGNYCYTPVDKKEPKMSIPSGHFNILYFSNIDGTLQYEATCRKTFEVLFTEDFLRRTAGGDLSGTFNSLYKSLNRKQNFSLWEKSRPIPVELHQNIKEIMTCRYCSHIRKIYLEAKITALLLNFLVDTTPTGNDWELPERDSQGIKKVEEYISKNLHKNITITEQATIAGCNTSKLKKNFKKVHGTTIFKYITRLRMEKAKELITTEKLTVSEASYWVGYKNPQHFTVAFKKYYGFLPSSLSSSLSR